MAGRTIHKLAGARPHCGNDDQRLVHFTDGKNGDVRNAGVDQFDGADGPLRIPRINIHEDDLGPLVLQLPQYRIAWTGRKTDVAQHRSSQMGALDAGIQDDGLFAILGKDWRRRSRA